MKTFLQKDNYRKVIIEGDYDHLEFVCPTFRLEQLDLYNSGIKNLYLNIPDSNKLHTLILPKDLKSLEIAKPLPAVTKITFPASLKNIAFRSFKHCNLNFLDLTHTKLEYIGDSAFLGSNLEHISFPPSLSDIDNCAFKETNLKDVCMPEKLELVNCESFADCLYLEKVDFSSCSEKVTINEWAFANCKNLRKINLPDKMDRLSLNAFNGTKVKTLILPNDISTLLCHDDEDLTIKEIIYTGNDNNIRKILEGLSKKLKISFEIPLDYLIENNKSFKEINNIYKNSKEIQKNNSIRNEEER